MVQACRRIAASLALCCALAVACCAPGCRSGLIGTTGAEEESEIAAIASYPAAEEGGQTPIAPTASPEATPTASATDATLSPVSDRGGSPAPTVGDTKALSATLAELRGQGVLDADTELRLLDSLGQTDPALWPELLAYFQAAASARRAVASDPAVIPVSTEQPMATGPELARVDGESVAVTLASDAMPAAGFAEQARSVEKPIADDAQQAPVVANEKSDQDVVPQAKPDAQPDEQSEASGDSSSDASGKTEGEAKPATASSTEPEKSKTSPKSKPKRKSSKAKTAAPGDWRQQLATSIKKLEQQTADAPATHAEIGQHAALRMMYLAAGRREDALKPIDGISPAQQDFWSKELYGLAAFIDHDRNPDASRRAAEANQHLRDASARLGELATLQVRNLAFCSEVTSYGVYKTFPEQDYQPGQEVLLYAEIENFKSEHSEQGYHTALRASYQILDERGARVDEKEFAVTQEYCQNPRRDFFVRYFIWIPQRIYGGTYTLQLSVEDTLSQKIGQSQLTFTVKSK